MERMTAMFDFNAILNATEAAINSPKIVSEQHDVNRIDIGGGAAADLQSRIAAIRKGGWDASEYGITAEQQIARWEATAADPVAMAREDEILRQRAIKRAGLDTSNGRISVMVAGKSPWHRLGINVESAVNSSQALALAGLAWSVSKRPLTYAHDGRQMEQSEVWGIVRDDTGAMLGSVGSRYQPIQNQAGFDFLDSVLAEHGARYETAGSIYGGTKVWMLVHLPQQRFAVNGSDSIEPYCLFTNPHDGSGQAFCFPTTERVVCANTFRVAATGRNAKGIGLRHTGNVKQRIGDAKVALGLAVKGFSEFKATAEAMAATKLPDIRHYASDVLDAVLEVTAAQAMTGADALAAAIATTEAERELARKSFAAKIERRGEILDDILSRYESEKCGVNGMRGTVWAGFNAVTESADYNRIGRQTQDETLRLTRRMESNLNGDSDELKQAAYTTAMEYMRA